MKKSVIAAAVSVGVVLAGAGIFAAVRASGKKPVQVMPVYELSTGYYEDSARLSAMISSDVSQNVHVTKNQKIKEVYVKEGQQVKVGDPLISYDMSLADLNLEIEQMKHEGIELRIQKAEADLKMLKEGKVPPQSPVGGLPEGNSPKPEKKEAEKMSFQGGILNDTPIPTEVPVPFDTPEPTLTPVPSDTPKPTVSPEPTASPSPTEEPAPEPTKEPEKPEEKPSDGGPAYKDRVYTKLTYEAYPVSGKGTEKDPYIFVCRDGNVVVTGDFLNKMAGYPQSSTQTDKIKDEQGNPIPGYHFRVEVRKDDLYNGSTCKAWIGNGEKLPWIHPQNVFVLEEQEALEKLNQALRPEVDASLLQTALEAAASLDITLYEEGAEMDDFLEALSRAQAVMNKVEREESVLQSAIDQALQALMTAQGNLKPRQDSGSGNGGFDDGLIGGGGGSTGPTYTKEEIEKMKTEKERELRQLNLDLRQSDLNVRKLTADTENQSINSTINGVVKAVGDPENPEGTNGEPFIQVASSEGLYVQGTLSELMLDQVETGQLLNGFGYESGVSFQAEVREVSLYPANNNYFGGMGNSNASYYPFIAYIEDAAGLKNFEMVELNMQGGTSMDSMEAEMITLSKAFIRNEDGIDYVMKEGENGRLVRQEVELGRIIWGDAYEIRSGLTAEDKIAFPYGKEVKEGAKTEVISAAEFWEDAYA